MTSRAKNPLGVLPVKVRFALAGVAVAVIGLIGAGLAIGAYDGQVYRAGKAQEISVQARIFAASVTAALVFDDPQVVREYVDALRANPDIDAAAVYNAAGRRVAATSRPGADPVAETAPAAGAASTDDFLTLAQPVMQNGERVGTVYLRIVTEPLARRISRYGALLLLLFMASLVVAILVTVQGALRRANTELSAANENLRTQIRERERAEDALRQAQKMEAVGHLTGGIAHDFNNMLAVIIASLGLLKRRAARGETDLARYADSALEGANRAATLTQRLLAFARRQALKPEPVDPNRLVTGMSELLRRSLGETVRIETVLAGGAWRINADAHQLENAILNLAVNARDAMPASGGRLTIETANVQLDDKYAAAHSGLPAGQYAMIAVSDTGAGMTAEVIAKAFERALAEAREKAERKRAEQEVHELNATLEAQVEARTKERDRIWRLSPDLFAVIDLSGQILAVNPAWSRVLAHDERALLTTSLHDLTHPDDAAATRVLLTAMREAQRVERFEGRLRRSDGAYRWFAWTVVPEGDVFYAVGRDATLEKESAAKLLEANAKLKAEIAERERVEATLRQMQRLEAIGQLTSGVSHDFNNLLTVILGNVDMLERALASTPVAPKTAARVDHIRTAAERGAKLTAQLLAFSRRQRLEPKAVNLNDTVANMRDLLQSTLGGAVRLETVLKTSLWPALVDPTQIEMIILNLAINARDAMEVGGGLTVETGNVTLTTAPTRPEEPLPGEYVVLTVSDTGSGMTPEVLAKAFEPFFTTKAPGQGSGLGLAQVFGFAKQSGGGVRIDTRLGEGTSVKVYMPRAASVQVEPPRAAPAPASTAAPGLTVLVVDDDSAVREVTAAILDELGYHVIAAGSGSAALDILGRDQTVHLLLVDYAMPGMNGMETAIAAQRLRPQLPILFVTGYADLAALREIGEERVIQKPYRDDELRQKIDAVLTRARTTEPKIIRMPRRA